MLGQHRQPALGAGPACLRGPSAVRRGALGLRAAAQGDLVGRPPDAAAGQPAPGRSRGRSSASPPRAFGQRRKMLRGALAGLFADPSRRPRRPWPVATARAEELSVGDFVRLADALGVTWRGAEPLIVSEKALRSPARRLRNTNRAGRAAVDRAQRHQPRVRRRRRSRPRPPADRPRCRRPVRCRPSLAIRGLRGRRRRPGTVPSRCNGPRKIDARRAGKQTRRDR